MGRLILPDINKNSCSGSRPQKKEEIIMKSFEYTVTDPVGIHARPAGLLVKEAKQYGAAITITKDGKSADAKKLMMLMGLGVKKDDTVTVSVEGEDEDAVVAKIEEFFKNNL
jgi:phosphocarrier protein